MGDIITIDPCSLCDAMRSLESGDQMSTEKPLPLLARPGNAILATTLSSES